MAHSSGLVASLICIPGVGRAVGLFIDHSQPLGALGVELFFILSGFLIGRILINLFLTAEPFTFSNVKNFWIRRWFRTLPNYWLILSVNIILYQLLHIRAFTAGQLLYYPFLQNLWYPNPDFYNEAWSLSIEEWFYLTLPVVMYLSSLLFRPEEKGRFLLKVFAAYLSVFVIIRFLNAFDPINGNDQDSGIRKVVLFRLDAVMYGVLVAYFDHFKSNWVYKMKNIFFVMSVAGVAILFFLIAKRDIQFRSSSHQMIRFFSNAFLYLFFPLFFSLCLPFAKNIKSIGRISGLVRFISRISYSMYLIHYSLIYLPFFYSTSHYPVGMVVILYAFYWLTVLGLSAVIYHCYEKPILKLRDRIFPG